MIDVKPEYLDLVKLILDRHVPKIPVKVFGSRVAGKAKKHSDLDLVLMTDKPLSLKILGALQDGFSESDLPWRVDVVDWSAITPEFRKIILATAVDL